jgi:hypothetical protein
MVIPILQIISFIIAFLLQQYQPPAPPVEKFVFEHPVYRPHTSGELQYFHPVYRLPAEGFCWPIEVNREQP